MASTIALDNSASAANGIRARLARALDAFIFGALLVWLALVVVPYGTIDPWAVALFECGVFALATLWLVEGWLSGGWFVREHRLLIPLLLIAAFIFAQTVTFSSDAVAGVTVKRAISADWYDTRYNFVYFIALILFAAMLWRYTSTPKRFRLLIYLIIGIGLANAFFGVARQVWQREPGFLLPRLQPGVGYGQFINRNHFAVLMEMALGLTLGLIVARGVRREHFLTFIALAIPIWAALVLSNSRGGIFSMLTQILFLAVSYRRSRDEEQVPEDAESVARSSPRWRMGAARTALIVALFIGIAFAAIWVGGESLSARLEEVPMELRPYMSETEGGENRRAIWVWTWHLIKDHPFAGVGFGAYNTAITQYHKASGEYAIGQAHNDYLELLASGGIVGVALVAWWFVLVVKAARRAWRASDAFRHAACVGALAGIFAVVVHSLVEFGLHMTGNACIFAALVVIATLRERVEAPAARRRHPGRP
jgi:O-antigen ligase